MSIQADGVGAAFAPVIQAIKRGRNVDRMDILGVNQTMLAINESVTPMSDTVSGLVGMCVDREFRPGLSAIAAAQDATQTLPYHNAVQAAKEMVSFVLISGLELADGQREFVGEFPSMMNEGVLAISLRYYGAEKVNRMALQSGGSLAELSYYDHALADGLIDGLPENLRYRVWDAIIQGCPLNRSLPGYISEPLLYRNISDAVVLPFIGISYELNMADRTRIRVQNEMPSGEVVHYHQDRSEMVLPKGSVRGSSYETFIRRMIDSGSAFRTKTGAVSGLLR